MHAMTKKRLLAFALALTGCQSVDAADTPEATAASASWLASPTEDLGIWKDWEAIPESHYFEIPVSKLEAAQHDLSDSQFLPLDLKDVLYFGGRGFQCETPANAYLVRALYMHGGTGRYTLYWAKSSLIVAHDSLGERGPLHNSAIVACLTQAPTAVYGQVGSDL